MLELYFFSGENCAVCHAIKPKLKTVVEANFSDSVTFIEINTSEQIEFAAQNLVFTLPVIILKAEGKELKRFVRSFGVEEVLDYIYRTT